MPEAHELKSASHAVRAEAARFGPAPTAASLLRQAKQTARAAGGWSSELWTWAAFQALLYGDGSYVLLLRGLPLAIEETQRRLAARTIQKYRRGREAIKMRRLVRDSIAVERARQIAEILRGQDGAAARLQKGWRGMLLRRALQNASDALTDRERRRRRSLARQEEALARQREEERAANAIQSRAICVSAKREVARTKSQRMNELTTSADLLNQVTGVAALAKQLMRLKACRQVMWSVYDEAILNQYGSAARSRRLQLPPPAALEPQPALDGVATLVALRACLEEQQAVAAKLVELLPKPEAEKPGAEKLSASLGTTAKPVPASRISVGRRAAGAGSKGEAADAEMKKADGPPPPEDLFVAHMQIEEAALQAETELVRVRAETEEWAMLLSDASPDVLTRREALRERCEGAAAAERAATEAARVAARETSATRAAARPTGVPLPPLPSSALLPSSARATERPPSPLLSHAHAAALTRAYSDALVRRGLSTAALCDTAPVWVTASADLAELASRVELAKLKRREALLAQAKAKGIAKAASDMLAQPAQLAQADEPAARAERVERVEAAQVAQAAQAEALAQASAKLERWVQLEGEKMVLSGVRATARDQLRTTLLYHRANAYRERSSIPVSDRLALKHAHQELNFVTAAEEELQRVEGAVEQQRVYTDGVARFYVLDGRDNHAAAAALVDPTAQVESPSPSPFTATLTPHPRPHPHPHPHPRPHPHPQPSTITLDPRPHLHPHHTRTHPHPRPHPRPHPHPHPSPLTHHPRPHLFPFTPHTSPPRGP